MKRNLENIIDFSHSRNTTDISAIFISFNASDQSAEEFIREIQESQLTKDKAARLVDIISDQKLSQGVLIVGNKRMHLRPHQSIFYSMSEVTQIGESQSFFLPESFTGTSQQCQRISNILEEKLLKLIPIDINRLEIIQEISGPKPQISSSLISRFSLRQRAQHESLIINDEKFSDLLKGLIKEAPLGAGLMQFLIQEAAGQIHEAVKAPSQQSESQNKRDHVQGELDFVTEDSDSPYIRQVKRLLTRDCESGKGDGKLVAIQSLRDTEEIANSMLSCFYQKSSDMNDKQELGQPKVVIIASQNKRLEQIQDTIDHQFIKNVTDPPFKLYKSNVSKASKQKNMKKDQEKHESFRAIFDLNQVFVLLDKKFFSHLTYAELDITEVDYLIFDETQSIYPESTNVEIMNKFIFNHTLMLSPAKNPDLLEDKRLPKVLAFFTLESVLQAAQNIDSQIMKKFYFLANTFNASLLCIQKQDVVKIESDIVREFSQNRVRNIEHISHLANQVKSSLEFQQKARKYLSFRRDGETRVTCQPQRIIDKKRLQQYHLLQTQSAKITLDEAMHVIQELGAQQQAGKQNINYKPIIESSQWVFNKVRYFSSRIQFDEALVDLLGHDNVKQFASQQTIPSQRDRSREQLFWLCSNHIYLKKTQSESQAALEMCKILYSLGYLDQNLRPSLFRQSKTLFGEASSISNDSQSTQLTSHHQQKDEEEKTNFSDYQSTQPSTQYNPSLKSEIGRSRQDNTSLYDDNLSLQNIEKLKMKIRLYYGNPDQQLEEAKHFFTRENKKNMIKLNKGLEKGQHHMPIMQFNKRQLELFIQTILNPILRAICQYNKLCNSEIASDQIKFDDFDVNMISESSIKDRLFHQRFYEKQGMMMEVNQTFIQFKNYRQRMFNIYDKNNEQKNDQEYHNLVQLIDQSLERFKFPHFMTQHVKQYHSTMIGTPTQTAPKVQKEFNRKSFLTMLMIALSDKEPTTIEFEKVKNEMGRLAFVGDSIIILCQVITMIFSGKKTFSEKDLDAVKNKTVKTEKLKERAKEVGLDQLIIKAKYYQKTAPNPQIVGQQSHRELGDIIKSLAGLFSIYLGFGATYLLLSDFGIIEPQTSESMIKIGKFSVAQKVEILKAVSKNRKDLLDYERDKKMHLLDILCNQKYLGLNKEPLTGSEILLFWKKLVKSQGLYMKQKIVLKVENTQLKEDETQDQLKDFAIAISYTTKGLNGSMETVTAESINQNPNDNNSQLQTFDYQAVEIEEVKTQLSLEETSNMQQIWQNFQPFSVDETASTNASSLKFGSYKYIQANSTEYSEDQSKTGGQFIDEGIIETLEPNQSHIEEFERAYKKILLEGYEFKNQDLLLQSIVHKSQSEKLSNSGTKFKDSSIIEKDIIMQYNLQIPEYLGDSILNFTISKLFYCETVDSQKKWHGDFFVPTKLHELKTWFSSNNWLSFALYDNFYSTITYEIPSDEHIEISKFAKKAEEAINQIQNKKILEKQVIELSPRVPLIYDQNDKFEEQINNFNGTCFIQCLTADKNDYPKFQQNPRESLKVTQKSLSLKLFKDKDVQQQDQNEVDFSEIDEKFVKYFSDVMEALIGAIFMDSGDLDKTQMILLKLINCPSVQSFPIVQHDRTAVLSVFNSKPYCKGIKLYHTLEEKDDGNIYIMGYMGKLQFRRLKYSKERKKKVLLFYYDMRLYLEDAYREFEMKFVQQRKMRLYQEDAKKEFEIKQVLKRMNDEKRESTNDDNDNDDIKENTATNDEWLEFNKDYRKTWKVKVYSADQKRYSAIKEAAKYLYKFVSRADENYRTLENQNIPEMRDQIIKYLNEGLHTIGANMNYSLAILESERVQSSRIRELLHYSDIKFIDCLSYNMKDVGNFIEKLNNRQVHQFYEHLIEFGKN